MMLCPFDYSPGFDIASDYEGRPCRGMSRFEPGANILSRYIGEFCFHTIRRMSIRMAQGMGEFSNHPSGAAVGLSLTLTEFIDHNVALAFNPVILHRIGDVTHPISFH